MLHYICSLPNRGEPGKIRELISDNPRAIEAFARQEDRPGRGVFDCVSLLRPGASRRSLEDVGEVRELFVDIDAKDLVDDLAAVDKRLTALPLLPSEIRNSGHGRHVGWRLKEPIDAADSAELSRAAAVLKRLTACLCGDMAVAHLAALLRHPGTHNSKNGEWHEVGYVLLTDTRYDLGDIDDWLDDLGSRSLFTRRPADSKHDNPPHVVGERNPPVDVEARLAAMKLHGPGDSSVHKTQLSCTASLLRTGMSLEETTRTVLEATRAVGDSKWNWRLEELKIMRMGADFVAKNPELLSLLPDGWQQPFEAALAQGYHPDISRNQGGLYVRVWKKWKDSKNRRYRKGAEVAEDAPQIRR